MRGRGGGFWPVRGKGGGLWPVKGKEGEQPSRVLSALPPLVPTNSTPAAPSMTTPTRTVS